MNIKVYVLSKRKDAELEQAIHDMDAYHLRIALYGVARGWQFDEAFSIAEEAAQHSVQRDGFERSPSCTCDTRPHAPWCPDSKKRRLPASRGR